MGSGFVLNSVVWICALKRKNIEPRDFKGDWERGQMVMKTQGGPLWRRRETNERRAQRAMRKGMDKSV